MIAFCPSVTWLFRFSISSSLAPDFTASLSSPLFSCCSLRLSISRSLSVWASVFCGAVPLSHDEAPKAPSDSDAMITNKNLLARLSIIFCLRVMRSSRFLPSKRSQKIYRAKTPKTKTEIRISKSETNEGRGSGVEGKIPRSSTLISLGPDNQNRIARVTHDLFRDASQSPTLYPRPSVGAHGDQIVRCPLRQFDNLVGSGAYRQNGGDLLDAVLLNLAHFRLQISGGFLSHQGQESLAVRNVGSVCSAEGSQWNLIRAREHDFETQFFSKIDSARQHGLSHSGAVQRHHDALQSRFTVALSLLIPAHEQKRIGSAPQHLLGDAAHQPPVDPRAPAGSHGNERSFVAGGFLDDDLVC